LELRVRRSRAFLLTPFEINEISCKVQERLDGNLWCLFANLWVPGGCARCVENDQLAEDSDAGSELISIEK
jgi:hypothetical protein